MTEYDSIAFREMIDAAQKARKKKVSKKEALRRLMAAGILDENANFTEPYRILETVIKRRK